MSILAESAIFLAAAVLAVPLSKRLGLGSVLGYLAAGLVIGPSGFGLIADVHETLHFAEFGVVLLLFIIGLELQPSRLWILRKSVFGLGGAQVLSTGALLALAAHGLGLPWKTSVIAGLGLSMSSTAFALQILAEKEQLMMRHGRSSFAILLFQDLAVIPLLAIVPLLGATREGSFDSGTLLAALKVIAVLAGVILGGRYLLRPILRVVAAIRIQEIFTATTLLVVVGTALAMQLIGLSMALGAFLAGMLLADSEYRHELEADIEPFKGLLLGLFFISVGMSVNLGLLTAEPLKVLGLVAGLVTIKAAVLYALGQFTRHSSGSSRSLAAVLSQGGEFAFVLFGVAAGAQVMDKNLADLLVLVVTISMGITPLLVLLNETILQRWLEPTQEATYDQIPGDENRVIIAGFGRFGQIIARILRAKKVSFTALEISSEQVDFVRRFGNKIYYGDASRLDLLRAARADKAEVLVLAIDNVDASIKTAEVVRTHFPDLKIYARARNRQHVYKLMDLGVHVITREMFHSSLRLASEVLGGLGLPGAEVERSVQRFREHDEKRLADNYAYHDDQAKMADLARQAAKELEDLFEQDAREDAAA